MTHSGSPGTERGVEHVSQESSSNHLRGGVVIGEVVVDPTEPTDRSLVHRPVVPVTFLTQGVPTQAGQSGEAVGPVD